MADPYATRRPDLSGRPAGPPPWEPEATGRGGSLVDAGGDFDGDCEFAVIPCSGIGTLAPVAMVEPPLAVLLWLEHRAVVRDGAAAANDLLARLQAFASPILAVKQGSVGGPPERRGCAEIEPGLIGAVLGALDGIDWERDPDFDYQVAASVPGLADPGARMLMPRLLYADNDRAYEHASLIADKKRERHAIAAATAGLDPRILAASGWPPEPTGGEWRD